MAFQHAGRTGVDGVLGRFGAWLDRGPYSHTEIVLSDGRCCTAETGQGVVIRPRPMAADQWSFIRLPDYLEPRVIDWYEAHRGQPYDWRGNFRFVSGLISHDKDRWFCTESNMAALGFDDPWRYGPNGAYALLHKLYWRL